MNASFTDVVVHVDENLDENSLKSIEDAIRQLEGVISVGHTQGKRHLLLVVFNSSVIGSGALLKHVKERGVHAELVAM